MKTAVTVLLMCSLLLSCVKDESCGCEMPYQIYYLKAAVTQTADISCGKLVLDFSEDSVRVRSLSKTDKLQYSVIGLQASYIAKDKKLYVSITLLKAEEEFACTAIGISYPHIKVVDAKERE